MQEFNVESFYKPGDIIQGRYRVLKVVAAGPLAIIYHVSDEMIDEEIALKLLNPAFFSAQRDRETLRKNLDRVAEIQHPSICPIIDINEEYDPPFFTLKFFDALSLRKLLSMRAE